MGLLGKPTILGNPHVETSEFSSLKSNAWKRTRWWLQPISKDISQIRSYSQVLGFL